MKKILYLTHWRFPSEKTMTPLIMKTCVGFMQEGFMTELWIPWRQNYQWKGKDSFQVHGISERFRIRRIFAVDLLVYLGRVGFILMIASFNITAFCLLLFGNRKNTIVYAHDVRDVILPSLLGYPVFVEIHDFYDSSQSWINGLVFKHSSGLIVTNSIKQKAIQKRYGFPLAKMIRQPNAVDYDFFAIEASTQEARAELGLPATARIVLYTGHLFSWKGVNTLAEASAYLPDDTFIYFVGGTPEDRDVLKAFVIEHALPRIVFVSHQPHDRIPLFMRASDVLVLPNTALEDASKYETSPVKLFEYLCSGVPVVASDLPSIRDIVTDREVQFFRPDDPLDLAKKIQLVLTNEPGTVERVSAGKAYALTCSWEARARHIGDIIRANT